MHIRVIALLLIAQVARAQSQSLTGTIVVRLSAEGAPVTDVPVTTRNTNAVTDRSGRAIFNLPTGQYTFRAAPPGYRPESLSVFVGVGTTTRDISLRPQTVQPQGLPRTVSARVETAAPRSALRATNIRVVDRAALDEQIEQSPGVIADALNRVDGVRVQTLSAGSGGVGIRIRGLPARYTKLLVDGLPLTGATIEGQNPLQISALGLDRIEVTPGLTSAFSGPTALSGTVNVMSATPNAPSQVVLNGASNLASDAAVFQTHTFSPALGATLIAGRHYRAQSDPDNDGWAEVGAYRKLVFRPSVWWKRSARSEWFMTAGWTSDDRRGGSYHGRAIPLGITFSDDANTRRADVGTVGHIQLDSSTVLTVRGSLTREWRNRVFGEDRERSRRVGVFSDVSATRTIGAHGLTGGVAIDRDQYVTLDTRDNFRYTTPALYADHAWQWGQSKESDPKIAVRSSARLDLTEFGDFVSPRFSAIVRPTPSWAVRVSRANGVYLPTPLTDESEASGLRYVDMRRVGPEHAQEWSVDVEGNRGPVDLRASGYRTVIANPLAIRVPPGSAIGLQVMNADEPAKAQGVDLSAHWRAGALRMTAAYSYVDADRPMIGTISGVDFEFDTTMHRAAPYTPPHSARLEAVHERASDRLFGAELRFIGTQAVADSSVAPSRAFVTLDARFEKHVRKAIVFVRGSNLLNLRQSNYAPLLRTSAGAAGQLADNVWAPLEGIVLNAGVRILY